MKTEDIIAEIEKDSVIDDNALDSESLKIPMLHAKYYRIYMDEFRTLRALDLDYKALKKGRVHYYTGKADDEVYKQEPLNFKVLKNEVDLYLDSDDQLTKLKTRIEMQTAKVNMIEQFIKTLNNRNFIIKNAIDYKRFKSGA